MTPIDLKSPPELAKMRQAGRIVAEVLELLTDMAEPGLTTEQLDSAAADHIREQGGIPAFKGYRGFPANICTSLNEEIVHGIPGNRKLRDGDLLKLDVGVIWHGYFGDAATSVPIGQVSDEAQQLMQAARDALSASISVIRAGIKVSAISAAIQQLAESRGFSVVTDYTGHGIGRALHEDPKVPNFVPSGLMHHDPVLQKGATVAVEPMVNAGTHRTQVLSNGWTVVTRDGKLSAHFEHTVAVDDDGPVILTLP